MRGTRLLIAASLIVAAPGTIGNVSASEPSTLFKTKCTSCHTFGKGDRVGPDLKGVTERRPRGWLIAWIKSSETQIRLGDQIGVALFNKYRHQRMPDHDLSDGEVSALLDYLAAGGPAADEPHQLHLASDATTRDVELGKKLFMGDVPLSSGAVACVSCHAVSGVIRLGGSFAPDLGDAYRRYLDWALDQRLTRPCVTGTAMTAAAVRVAESESLALRAFLRSVGR